MITIGMPIIAMTSIENNVLKDEDELKTVRPIPPS